MSDDDALQRLFRDGDVADEGFTRTVMLRVNHLRRRRRVVLGSAAAVGAAVAVPALWHALPALATAAPWTHLFGASALGVTALCVSAAALWVVTVSVEA
jgi:hypothetical protein